MDNNELKKSALLMADRLDFLAIGLEKAGLKIEAKVAKEKAKNIRNKNK